MGVRGRERAHWLIGKNSQVSVSTDPEICQAGLRQRVCVDWPGSGLGLGIIPAASI